MSFGTPKNDKAAGESEPLLKGASDVEIGDGEVPLLVRPEEIFGVTLHTDDHLRYDVYDLMSWKTFMFKKGTVWDDPHLWYSMARLVCLSLIVGALVIGCVTDPRDMDTQKLSLLSNFLKVFVAFLLGFFMSSSVGRWTQCITGFMILGEHIRSLQVQLHALGVEKPRINLIFRYCMVSCDLLSYCLRIDGLLASTKHNTKRLTLYGHSKEEEKKRLEKIMWGEFERTGDLTPAEVKSLEPLSDHAQLLWVWIGSLIGRMAQDGEIPPMASPTYGRVMNLCQAALDAIRRVRAAVTVQVPFVYVQTLASLVHLNSILCAISFGLTLGKSSSTILGEYGVLNFPPNPNAPKKEDRPVLHELEQILTALLICFVAPFLYQAFFEIGLMLSAPFNSDDGYIPTEIILGRLKRDLEHGDTMADCPPMWDAPCYKRSPHRHLPASFSQVGYEESEGDESPKK